MSQLSESRRKQVLEAACACAMRRGFHQTSMQEICLEAGISPGTVYRYFRGKEEIIAALCERERTVVREMFGRVEHVEGLFPRLDALVELTQAWMDTPGQAALYLEIAAEGARNPQVAEMIAHIDRASLEPMVAMLREAQERGEIGSHLDADLTARSLIALADGFTFRRALDPTMRTGDYFAYVKGLVRRILEK